MQVVFVQGDPGVLSLIADVWVIEVELGREGGHPALEDLDVVLDVVHGLYVLWGTEALEDAGDEDGL